MKCKQASGWLALALVAAICGMCGAALAGANLVVNGGFDDPENHLNGWRYKYDADGESWYANNHTLISVVEKDSGRQNVLQLHGTYAELQVPGQGVKVDSFPIPIDIGKGKYRFSIFARSTGPKCRILIEGYRWAPGVTPHDKPLNTELRKCFKFSQVYFGKQEAGETAAPGSTWQKGTVVFPDPKFSDLAKKSLVLVKFIVIHIIAIDGKDGDLLVDDARIEKIQ